MCVELLHTISKLRKDVIVYDLIYSSLKFRTNESITLPHDTISLL